MLKYESMGSAISVSLENGYSIMALIKWDQEKQINVATLYLKDNKIPVFDLIEKCEELALPNPDDKNLKSHMTNFIERCFLSGLFNEYIKRFQYQQKCFDIGSEIINELERKGGDSNRK